MLNFVRRLFSLPVSKFRIGQRVLLTDDAGNRHVGTVRRITLDDHAGVELDRYRDLPWTVPVNIPDAKLVSIEEGLHGFYWGLRFGGLFTLFMLLGLFLYTGSLWLLGMTGIVALALRSSWNWGAEETSDKDS